MKIIQINAWLSGLHHQLLDFINEQNPDIICAQEIYSSNLKIGIEKEKYMLFEALKDCLGYGYFSPTWSFDYLGQKIHHGNAILSRLPIKNKNTTFTNGEYCDLSSKINPKFTNIRNIQSCELNINNRQLLIVNHHGYHELNSNGSEKSIKSMEQVIKHINASYAGNKPLIFCGDLNLNPDSKPIKLFESSTNFKNLVVERKIKTTLSDMFRIKNLKVVCDYIFTSNDVKVIDFYVSPKVVSDHKALILEFGL